MTPPNVLLAMAALSHEHRFAVYRMLVDGDGNGVAAGVIAATIGIAPSSLTFHLQQLQRAGLVRQRRVGRNLIYTADVAVSRALVDFLTLTCCGPATGDPPPEHSNGMDTCLQL